jgi:hypothetical protein
MLLELPPPPPPPPPPSEPLNGEIFFTEKRLTNQTKKSSHEGEGSNEGEHSLWIHDGRQGRIESKLRKIAVVTFNCA